MLMVNFVCRGYYIKCTANIRKVQVSIDYSNLICSLSQMYTEIRIYYDFGSIVHEYNILVSGKCYQRVAIYI